MDCLHDQYDAQNNNNMWVDSLQLTHIHILLVNVQHPDSYPAMLYNKGYIRDERDKG